MTESEFAEIYKAQLNRINKLRAIWSNIKESNDRKDKAWRLWKIQQQRTFKLIKDYGERHI